jgi:hypothetical protein
MVYWEIIIEIWNNDNSPCTALAIVAVLIQWALPQQLKDHLSEAVEEDSCAVTKAFVSLVGRMLFEINDFWNHRKGPVVHQSSWLREISLRESQDNFEVELVLNVKRSCPTHQGGVVPKLSIFALKNFIWIPGAFVMWEPKIKVVSSVVSVLNSPLACLDISSQFCHKCCMARWS